MHPQPPTHRTRKKQQRTSSARESFSKAADSLLSFEPILERIQGSIRANSIVDVIKDYGESLSPATGGANGKLLFVFSDKYF